MAASTVDDLSTADITDVETVGAAGTRSTSPEPARVRDDRRHRLRRARAV